MDWAGPVGPTLKSGRAKISSGCNFIGPSPTYQLFFPNRDRGDTNHLEPRDLKGQPRRIGTVKYVGPVEGFSSDWVGVDWDADGEGKHNGSHSGASYFTARGPIRRRSYPLSADDFAKKGLGHDDRIDDINLSEEEMEMFVDLHPFTNASPYTVVETMSLAKALILFGKLRDPVVGILTRHNLMPLSRSRWRSAVKNLQKGRSLHPSLSFGGSQSFSLGDILDEFIQQTLGTDISVHIAGRLRVSRSKRWVALKSFNDKANMKFFYSSHTPEEKVLILAKQGRPLEGNNILSDIKQSTCNQLLTWGANYLFEKLNEFHDNISKDDDLENVFVELSSLLPDSEENSNSTVCGDKYSFIVKAQQIDGIYPRNIFLHGELEKDSLMDNISLVEIRKMVLKDSHVFWTELLEERSPRWKYFSNRSRRARKNVHRFEELLELASKKCEREVKRAFYPVPTNIRRKTRSKVRNRDRRRKLVVVVTEQESNHNGLGLTESLAEASHCELCKFCPGIACASSTVGSSILSSTLCASADLLELGLLGVSLPDSN
ncbi:putative chloride channel-like protein clc-g [Phtheirospermum japonicum]|uniref:Putative chloride channel-like protein clc-g n=1 Tax=Phtheirospermum japonicum TaxID=374723 RepID=A0A830D1E9_9LAMI|nr:putative chloride channel-like protein clc-g [Phtheirospermum japonicum]